MAALTIVPFSLQENPKRLEERTQEWVSDVQPQNAIERDPVRGAARLMDAIERGERIETQMLGAWRRTQIRELGRRLLYVAGPEEVKVDKQPLWADDPGLLVSQLEESAEGCRWLLERWEEYRNLLDHKSKWEEPVLIRFIRLQGKQVVESVYDPALNSIFLAWDVLVPKYAKVEWESFGEKRPKTDPAYNHRLHWREIAPRPSDPAEAWAVLYAVVEQHEGRLKELLASNEASEAAEDADWADRAALDCSPAFERHRRYQSAKTRELLRTLDTLRKLRNADFGMGNGEKADGKCRMADAEWQMANDECQVAEGELQVAEGELKMGDEQCEVQAGGCVEGQSSEPMTEGSAGPVVGHDSQRVIDDSTNNKNGILSHEGAHAAGQPGQGDGGGQCLADDVTTPQKALNKANLESKQSLESQELKSRTAVAEGRKQSQRSQGETSRKPRSRDGRPARQSGRRPVASEAEGSELLRAAESKAANHVSRVPESGWPLPLRAVVS